MGGWCRLGEADFDHLFYTTLGNHSIFPILF